MRVRTVLGVLFGVAVVLAASYLTQQNFELLSRTLTLAPGLEVRLWAAMVGVFLAGFLPTVSVLVVQHLRRELVRRRERRASREEKSLEGSFRRAVDLAADEQWARAADELDAVLGERPEEYAALLRYGQALRRQGRGEEALAVHRRASVLYPGSVALLYELAADYEREGEERVAREVRDRVLRDFPGFGLRILRRRRDAALEGGKPAEAGRLHDRLLALLAEVGQEPDEADRRLGLTLAVRRARSLVEEGRGGEAVDRLAELVDAHPGFVPAVVALGDALVAEGRDEEAMEAWRSGYRRTGEAVFLERVEDRLIARGEPERAIESLHRARAESADELLPRFLLGRLYARLEMHERALEVLAPLAERLDPASAYHLARARLHDRLGQLEAARDAYRTAAERAGLAVADHRCRRCGEPADGWRDRCAACGAWGEIALHLPSVELPEVETGERGPVWTPRDGERG